jgi:small subunit ribosomal protein S16
VLVIRLSRVGRKNLAHFKLVAQEKSSSPKSAKYVAILGSYDPTQPENKFSFDKEAIEKFIKNGAVPSDTVARLLTKNGMKGLEKFQQKYTHQVNEEKAKAEAEAKKKAAEEAAAKKAAEEAAKAEAEKPAEEAAPAEEKQAEAAAEEPKAEAAPAEEKPADAPAEEEKKD